MHKGFGKLLLRGLLGGALGGFVLILGMFNPVRFGIESTWAQWLVFGYLVLGLPLGAFIGGVVGVGIWLIHRKTGSNLGPLRRAVIGMTTAMLAWDVFFRLNDPEGYSSDG